MSEKKIDFIIDREYIKNMPPVIQMHELGKPCKCDQCVDEVVKAVEEYEKGKK